MGVRKEEQVGQNSLGDVKSPKRAGYGRNRDDRSEAHNVP